MMADITNILSSPDTFYQHCKDRFLDFMTEGQDLYPSATASHLCVRTKDDIAYDTLLNFSQNMGIVKIHDHNGNKMFFLKLEQPFYAQDQDLHYLEITGPKTEYDFTAPQMLVFADPSLENPIKIPSAKDPVFTLRAQAKAAEQLVL